MTRIPDDIVTVPLRRYYSYLRDIAGQRHRKSVPELEECKDRGLYYKHCVQYFGSEFFRSWFGVNEVWDEKLDQTATDFLTGYYQELRKQNRYSIRNYQAINVTHLRGIRWEFEVPPDVETMSFNRTHPQHCRVVIHPGDIIEVRQNEVESPHRFDVQLYCRQHKREVIITMSPLPWMTARKFLKEIRNDKVYKFNREEDKARG